MVSKQGFVYRIRTGEVPNKVEMIQFAGGVFAILSLIGYFRLEFRGLGAGGVFMFWGNENRLLRWLSYSGFLAIFSIIEIIHKL